MNVLVFEFVMDKCTLVASDNDIWYTYNTSLSHIDKWRGMNVQDLVVKMSMSIQILPKLNSSKMHDFPFILENPVLSGVDQNSLSMGRPTSGSIGLFSPLGLYFITIT